MKDRRVTMDHPILEIQGLTKYYGKHKGVENLSLQLYPGEVFGFIGPNGAGKSTTIRCIMNLINKTSGTILYNHKPLHKNDTVIKSSIGYLPSEIHLYDDLSVKEMLDYHESFYSHDLKQRRSELVKRFQLDEAKQIEDLSLGNLKKLGIILAFMHQPKLLILDEPTSGLDPIMQNVFYELLAEEKARGNTILYSTHILSEVSKICDRIGIIKDGNLIQTETVTDLLNNNLTYVTVSSPQIDEIISELQLIDFTKSNQMVRFKNEMSHDKLIKKLSQYQIERLLIEEANPEDMFFRYYEQENEHVKA